MNTYYVKYEGCDEQGRIHVALSWTGNDEEFKWHESLGEYIFGIRGFARDARPTFTLLEEVLNEDVWYIPALKELLRAPYTEEGWNTPTPVDTFLWSVVTSLKARTIISQLEPGFTRGENIENTDQ